VTDPAADARGTIIHEGLAPTDRAFRLGPVTGLAISRIVASAISGVWFIVAARELSLSEFGDLATLLALMAIAVTVNDAGLQIVLMDHVGRWGVFSSDFARRVVSRRLVYAAVCAAAIIPFYLLATDSGAVAVPLIATGSLLGTAVYQTLLSGYRVTGRVRLDGANEVCSRLVVLGLGYLWLRQGGGLLAAVSVYAIADLASAVVVTLLVRRRFVAREPGGPPDLRLRATAPVALAIVLAVVYYRVDLYMIRLIQGPGEAGLYGAAYRLLDVAGMGGLVLSQIVMRHVAPLEGRAKLTEAHRFLVRGAAVGLLVAVAGAVLARPVLSIAFGEAFEPAVPMALVLLGSVVPGSIAIVMTPIAGIASRHRYVVVTAAALVANVSINLVAIPRYGGVGAACATLITQFGYAGGLYSIVRSSCREDGSAPERPANRPSDTTC